MAVEADSVVVTLLAQNDQFDAAAKSSAANFAQSMGDIQKAGAGAEAGVGQFSSALKANRLEMNQSRVGMMEFQHIARGVSDQFASGGVSTQLFTSHIGELSEAIVLSGGAFGKLGLFLQGPWGIALTLAATAVATLIASHKNEGDTLDATYDKLVKHKEQTELNAAAEELYSHSIDGLVESLKKLDDELQKSIGLSDQTPGDKLAQAIQKRIDLQGKLNDAQKQQNQLIAERDRLQAIATAPETRPETQQTLLNQLSQINAQIAAQQNTINAATAGISKAEQTVRDASVNVAQSVATATADSSKHIAEFATSLAKELAAAGSAGQLASDSLAGAQTALDDYKKAEQDAATQGLNFEKIGAETEVKKLTDAFVAGRTPLESYVKQLTALTASLEAAAEAAKKNPVEQFKQAVIGAEGTGQNKAGSPAAGLGQFMPGTFESYFKQLYPQQAAGMSNSQIDNERNVRDVVNAVLDAATKDYVTVLKAAGQQITEASLYTVHVLGAPDARKFFAASDDESVVQALGGTGHARAVAAQNGTLFTGTVGQAKAQLAQRIGDSSGAVSTGASAIQKQIDDEAKKEAEQLAAFNAENDRLNSDLLAARKSQVKDTLTQLGIQEEEVTAELQKRDDTYQSAVSTGKLTQAQADQLKAVAAEVAAAKMAALQTEEQAEIAKRAHDAEDQSYGFAEEDLKAQDAAATSQDQHRELQLAILDIVYQQKEADLEYLKLQAIRNGQLDQANLIQGQIDNLPSQKAADRAQTIRGTMDPLEAWLHAIPNDAKAVTEALQGIATNGFDQIASSIAGVVTGTETLGQAFSNVAKQIIGDIVQMTIKMLIFRALSSFLGGGMPAPDIGSNWDVGLSSSPLTSLGGALDLSGLPSFASGGFGIIGGTGGTDNNLLSLNGAPVAWVSSGEGLAITPSNGSAASPAAGNSVLVVKVEPNDDRFDAYVESIAGPLARAAGTRAAYGGAAMARNNLARRQIHALGS